MTYVSKEIVRQRGVGCLCVTNHIFITPKTVLVVNVIESQTWLPTHT